MGIEGNEVVDRLAKEGLLHKSVDYPILKDISDLNTILENKLIQEWQSMWDSNKKGRFYYKLQSTVFTVVKFSDSDRGKQTCITRLRFGKCLLGDVLFMMQNQYL